MGRIVDEVRRRRFQKEVDNKKRQSTKKKAREILTVKSGWNRQGKTA